MSSPPFSGAILQQVLQFLLPKDVAHATMVCKVWRDDLQPQTSAASKAVWKQAVTNSNTGFIQAVIQEATRSSTTASEKEAAIAQIDFHAFPKGGFGRRKKPDLPEPTFRIEDLLIVLELKLEKVVKDENGADTTSVEFLGTFSVKGSEKMLNETKCGEVEFELSTDPTVKVEADNPLCPETYNGDALAFEEAKTKFRDRLEFAVANYPDQALWMNMDLPYQSAGQQMSLRRNLKVTSVTLVRCDDRRCFCLLEDDITFDECQLKTHESPEHDRVYNIDNPPWGLCGQSPFALNKPGAVAREVLASHQIATMTATVMMDFECVLPSPGSTEEPSWLQKFRKTTAADTEWSEQDEQEISQVKSFQFRLGSISLSLGEYQDYEQGWGEWKEYWDPKGFLFLLEGLDWL